MPNTITTLQLQQYRNSVATGGVSSAIQIYNQLYAQGYNYAGWAAGVAGADSFSGTAALKYLQETAMMGIGGTQGATLTQAQIDQIRIDMALGALDEYIRISENNGGSLSRDFTYQETRAFHEYVFEANGLTLDNWTLETPMDIIRERSGDAVAEDFWRKLRDTGGDGVDAAEINSRLMALMDLYRDYYPDLQSRIDPWMSHFDSIADFYDITSDTVFENFKNYLDRWSRYDIFDDLVFDLSGFLARLKNETYRIQRYDPLALDLNGDGIVSTRADDNLSGPLFDFDADGYRTATGWVAPEDGLLVRDLNGSNTIDSGAELFGDQTLLRDGSIAATGFQALADLDANADGVVDASDAAFASLRIWQDANQDGITNTGELKTLTELGITSLSIAHSTEATSVAGGQRTGTGSYTRTDGNGNPATQVMQEFDFDSDTINGSYVAPITIPEELSDIPAIPGVGRMRSLREACALSSTLTQLVRQFMAAGTSAEQEQLMSALVQEWVKTNPGYSTHGIQAYTGGGVADPNSTNVIWLRPGELPPVQMPVDLPAALVNEIRVAEAVLGLQGQNTVYWANDNTNIFHNVYASFYEEVYKQLSYQTRLKPYIDKIALTLDAQGAFAIDMAPAFAMFNQLHATNSGKARSELAEFLVYISGAGLNDESSMPGAELLRNWLSTDALTPAQLAEITSIGVIYQDGSANQPQSTSGNDVIIVKSTASVGAYSQGGAGMDTLYGDVGNDTLGGGEGNDQLLGAAGNDSLSGGAGNDALYGGTGSDQLYGENGNDRLLGGDGADNLIAGDGNDTLSGGAGDDYLYGGNGEDIYLFGRGDGHDVLNNYGYQQNAPKGALVLGSGIAATDIKMWRSGNYLCISILGTTDRIDIADYFEADATGAYTVKEIRFADGTVWNVNYVKAVVLAATDGDDDIYGYDTDDVLAGGPSNDHLSGRGGNDVLNGGLGNDSLDGGKGNDQLNGEDGADYLAGGEGADILSGGAGTDTLADEDGDDIVDGGADADTLYSYGTGNDTFRFGRGSGADTLYNNDNVASRNDVIELGDGIVAGDISLRRSGSTLILSINGTSDSFSVVNFFADDGTSAARIDQVRFKDGTIWTTEILKTMSLQGTTGNDDLTGFDTDDAFSGGAGNDTIAGAAGNDQLSGGEGDDVLNGDAGNDVLFGELGADTLNGGDGDDALSGGDGMDALAGGAGNDTLAGGEGQDFLSGDAGDDVLDAGAGDDQLVGGEGNDQLRGGLGNDVLQGGAGDDRYYFARGDGSDLIWDIDGRTTVYVSQLSLEEIFFRREGTQLVVRFASSAGDEVRLEGFFDPATGLALRGINIDYGTGQVWEISPAALELETLKSTSVNDIIQGNSANNVVLASNGDDRIDGFGGNDTLSGGAGQDVLDGGVGQDTLSGGAGDDLFLIDDGGDTVIEASGEGVDTIESVVSYTLPANVEALRLVGSGNIDATGGSAGDKLYGNSGSNVLTGLAGNDELDGGAGADTLVGGQGDDTYFVDTGNDVVTELAGEGFDTVNATSSYALSDNVEKLVLLAGAYDGTGNSQDNELVGNADDNRLDGGAGADLMAGGEGNDIYVVDAAGDEVVELAGEGEDIVESSINYVLGDTLEHLVLTGTANVNATGNAGDNNLQGNVGNNVLDGGAGADHMSGGDGDDYYIADQSGDSVHEDTDAGTDTIERRYETNYILTNNVENLILGSGVTTGHGNELDNHIVGNSGGNSSLGLEGNDWIQGLGGNDQLFGDEGDDTVEGGTGNDYLEGGDGSDHLEGGDGNDQLGGGAGADTLIGGLGDDKYVLTLDGETDVIDNSHGGFDGIFFEETVSKEQLSFKRDGNDLLIIVDGNEAAPAARVVNHFLGGNYAIDYVQPSAPGSYYLTTAQINAKVAAYGTGYDTVMDGTELADTGGTALVGSSDKDWIRGLGGDDQMFGNSGDDKLQGGAGNDYLAGGLGNDTNTGNDILEGGDGNDTLAGQDGDDTLAGGVGNDTYMWDAGFDTIDNTGGGTDTLFFPSNIPVASLTFKQEGNDLLILVGNNPAQGVRVLNHFLGGDYALDYVYQNGGSGYNTAQMNQKAMAAGFDNVVQGTSSSETLNGTAGKDLMFGGNGNDTLNGAANDDRLLGEAGNDTLYGGAGTDKLEGGLGDDTYTIDDNLDVIVELAGEGNDLVNASVTYALGDNVERLTLTGSAAINGTGNALDNTLTGNSGANTLSAGAGNDTLNGGTGADTLVGGTGNDTYVVDNTGDVVTELTSEGTDLVQSSVTYTLSNNVENLTLTGTSAINGTGNVLDNVLTGNSGNNTLTGGGGNDTLDGGTGNDTMLGGVGNDTYVVNATGDVVTELAGEGTDLVQSGVTYTLGNNVENLTLTGTSAINATGNTLDNVLTGNSGNNTLTGGNGNDTLDGGAGNDTMVGGTGDDTYFVNTTSDVVTEQSGQGADTVVSGITYTLSTNLEHLTLSGTSAINGTGNASNNRLTGNAGNNALSAAAGDDVLEGGAGTDTLTGGTGKDTYVMARGYGADTVVENDTASGQLDVAKFLSGVSYDQLWFARPSGSNNLEITIIGTGDVLIVKDWYLGSQYRVEEIRTTDGNMVLTAAKVQDLVTAMASLTKPALGQTTLSAAYQTQLASVFASTWTPGGQGLLAGGARQAEQMTTKGIAATAMSESTTAGIMVGGCYPTPREERVGDWVADIGDRANGDRIQAWLADHGYASIEEWLDSDARPELPFGHLLDRFRDRQYADVPAGDTPPTMDRPWVVGEALPRPELGDRVDGQAMHSIQEWLSTLEQNPQMGVDDLYQSLVERYAQERTSQSNPVLDSMQPNRELHADVASNYQRLISAMSLAGVGESSLSANCEARRDGLSVETSWM